VKSRTIVLLLLTSIVVTLLILDRDVSEAERDAFGQSEVAPMPVADHDDVLATTWFCAAGTASDDGPANLTVVVANSSDVEATGAITWVPRDGEPVTTPIEVPALGSTREAATDAITADVVSAVVDVRGGEIGVEHIISGDRGASVAPCATDASPSWYFANGTTERDAVQVLALFNPFPDDAVVDIAFDTDEGRDEPAALQGLPVPAGSTTLVNVHDHVRRRAVTAAAIVARTGRLVADRIQSFDGTEGRRGVSLALGAPTLAEQWTFPEGFWTDGLIEEWHVYNPGDVDALASLELVPTQGEAVEPVDFTVPARGQVTLVASALERIPAGVGHTATIRSLDGTPIVAERMLDLRPPVEKRGWTSTLGSPLAAARWLLPFGEASDNTDEYVVIHNPTGNEVEVSVTELAGGQTLAMGDDVTIAPGGRVAIRLGDHVQRSPLPLLVEATGEVVVERDIYRLDAPGVSSVMGIPLRDR
jgi:hypothetical protein